MSWLIISTRSDAWQSNGAFARMHVCNDPMLSWAFCRVTPTRCMQGSIDQVDGLLCFDADAEGLKQWDEQIASICNRLNSVLESAAAEGLPVTA